MRPPIVHTLSRTISGSFISNISKQATPAPSDTGSEDGSQVYLDYSNDDDNYDFDQTFIGGMDEEHTIKAPEKPRAIVLTTPHVQIRTPSSTPTPPVSYSGRNQRKTIERLVEERDEARHELHMKVCFLKAVLIPSH